MLVKEEVLSADPWIAILYEVITDAQSDKMKNKAFPQVMLHLRIWEGIVPWSHFIVRSGKMLTRGKSDSTLCVQLLNY